MIRRDRGSATIWVIAAATLVLIVAMVAAVRTQAVLARHRAESAADLAALAVAGGIGVDVDVGAMCARGVRIARANNALLSDCSVDLEPSGLTGTVEVTVRVDVSLPGLGSHAVVARARAARLPPDTALHRVDGPPGAVSSGPLSQSIT